MSAGVPQARRVFSFVTGAGGDETRAELGAQVPPALLLGWVSWREAHLLAVVLQRGDLLMIAALFVATDGAYFGLPDVDPWDVRRDAHSYAGPHPVVAHPPCERWGRYWSGGPSAKVRRVKGDDAGCFESALASVRRWGGVLEHPEASSAWDHFGLLRPPKTGGWVRCAQGWTCCVEQGHYGHRARKATWLYAVVPNPPELIWGPSHGDRLDEGFHSNAERAAARAAGIAPVGRLSTDQRIATPPAFRDLLLSIARGADRC